MPPTLTYPGVYIQELISPVHSITGVATSIAAFVGYTKSGVDNRAQAVVKAIRLGLVRWNGEHPDQGA